MNVEKISKNSFTVIGKEGSTLDGEGFIQRLWQDANGHFEEIEGLAKRDEQGNLVGVWGAMSDLTRSFRPWDDFSKGLYLAGAECQDDAAALEGWVKWVIPAYESLVVEHENNQTFAEMIKYMRGNNLSLAGAVNDFTDPKTGKNYMYFPIRKL